MAHLVGQCRKAILAILATSLAEIVFFFLFGFLFEPATLWLAYLVAVGLENCDKIILC